MPRPVKIKIAKEFNGHRLQRDAWNSKARHIDILASRRCGKDWVCTKIFQKRVMADRNDPSKWLNTKITKKTPRLRYWVVGADYTCVEVFKEYMTDQMQSVFSDSWSNEKKMWLRGGVLIEFKSSVRPAGLRSNKLNGAYLIETAFFKRDSYMEAIQPMLANMNAWCLSTTTPYAGWYADELRNFPDPHQENYIVYDEKTGNPDTHFIYGGLTEEMKEYTGEVYDFAMRQKKTMAEDVWLRSWMARLDAFEGQIYKNFSSDKHVVDFPFLPEDYFLITAGQDWGTKGALIIIGFRKDGGIDILDEEYHIGRPVFDTTGSRKDWVQIAKESMEKYGIETIHADHDITCCDLYRSHDLPVKKAKKEVMDGIRLIQSCLASTIKEGEKTRPFFRVRPRCKLLIKEITQYRYAQNENDETERPIKVNDHSVDALRYAIFSNKREFKEVKNLFEGWEKETDLLSELEYAVKSVVE